MTELPISARSLGDALLRAVDELARIEADCLMLQESDAVDFHGSLSVGDLKRRQLLDRITQEIGALSDYVEAFAQTGSKELALDAVALQSVRRRLAGTEACVQSEGLDMELF